MAVYPFPYVTLLISDFREVDTFSFRKLCWASGSRCVHYGRSLSTRRRFNFTKNLRGLPGTTSILPKASFFSESQAQHLPDYWQNVSKVFENEASVAVKLLPNSIPVQSQSENVTEGILHYFSAIHIDLSIAAVAALVGSMLGYLVVALPTMRKEKLQNKGSENRDPVAEEWLLVMKSTPFNRFVMMRCPSIMFEDKDVQGGLLKKLSTDAHHATTISNHNGGKSDDNDLEKDCEWAGNTLQIAPETGPPKEDFTPGYQRVFLHTDDGGVLAVDWPSHLELSEKQGLDTSLLLVSGSADGSGDKGVQEIVKRSLKCGCFPIVLNPRGCGGSPLTTPRLFTAGDSDDVRTTVQFVQKSRPWATIMAVGWGYGANMLVKYLGEEAAPTPVAAAVCVDNIFNLEELNCPDQEDCDTYSEQKIMSGLVQILNSNQMVFKGKKEFDVGKGLLATSLRDFDKAISMVSKGYNDLQEFYKDSSSKSWINNVQIPVFYIQGIERFGNTSSVPPYEFKDNPFATLILRTLTKRNKSSFQATAKGLYDSLMVEWLAAVEVAFLKGRHPLLQQLDVTFQAQGRSDHLQSPRPVNGGELTMRKMNQLIGIQGSGGSRDYIPRVNDTERDLKVWNSDNGSEVNAPHKESKALVNTSKEMYSIDEEKLRSEEASASDKGSNESSDESADDESEAEQGQVRQAAESIMKVLDVTMPGTLMEKQKEEVLEAVGRGESIVTALQEACPEDVREKMTTAVSAAVQARGISSKLAGFGKSMPAPKIPEGMVENIQEKLSSMVQNKLPAFTHDAAKNPLPDNSADNNKLLAFTQDAAKRPLPDISADNNNGVAAHGDQPNISSQNESPKSSVQDSPNAKQPESSPSASHPGQIGNGAAMENVHKADSQVEEQVFTQGQTLETKTQNNSSSESKATEEVKGDSVAKLASNDNRTNQGDIMQVERGDPLPHEDQKHEGQDQNRENLGAAPQTTEIPQPEQKNNSSTSSEDHNPHEDQKREGQDQKQEKVGAAPQTTEIPQPERKSDSSTSSGDHTPDPSPEVLSSPPTPPQAPAAPPFPSIDVSRAFEALTGVDDSTQMAVTNVFGVIENVIERLEKDQVQKDEGQEDEPSEQPSLSEHQSSSTQTNHDKSDSGIDSQSQSVHDEPSGNNSGHHQILKMDSNKANRKVGETLSQTSVNREIDKTIEKTNLNTDHKFPAGSAPATLNTEQELHDDVDLALEYFEDENVWKLTDDKLNARAVSGTKDNTRAEKLEEDSYTGNTNLDTLETNQVIIPEYKKVDDEMKNHETESSFPVGIFDDTHAEFASESSLLNVTGSTSLSLQRQVRKLVVDALEFELLRRSSKSTLDTALQQDIEKVGSAVAETEELRMQFRQPLLSGNRSSEKPSEDIPAQVNGKAEKMHIETIINAINNVYGNLTMLPSLLPAGVLFGVVLAALSPLDIVSTDDDAQESKGLVQNQGGDSGFSKTGFVGSDNYDFKRPFERPFSMEQSHDFTEYSAICELESEEEEVYGGLSPKDVKPSGGADVCESEPVENLSAQKASPNSNNMMGAVAAAMGATVALASEKPGNESYANLSKHEQQRANSDNNDDVSKPSIVSTLAEKAMSVAAPVVPTKEDGDVDHERLVEILAGLGQKGGILRFVGKIALLWGGLRGAMSLTDRLLVFLHMSDRPLCQRLLGFLAMAVLMWTPVLVPLLPALLQQWASRSHDGVASTAALIGLYGAVVILITIWGRKIRGYEDSLQQYGVSIESGFNARQVLSLMSGLALGFSLVASVYLLGVSFHMIQFDWAPALSFSGSNTFFWNLASGWRIFKLLIKCFGISLAVSFVEELFFRSWLQEEISADHNFHRAAALSGLAFSISHWSLPVMPGLWLLSLALTGAKVRSNGDLSLAIGIHAGLMAGAEIIKLGGQVNYGANASLWFIGHQSADPFTGLIGISLLGLLALLLYPWSYNWEDKH